MEESKEKVSMSEEKGKISVIVPVYQAEKYLAKALDSVISQDYENWELFLLVRKSSDQSEKIVRDYEKKYNSIHMIERGENKAGEARNQGLGSEFFDFLRRYGASLGARRLRLEVEEENTGAMRLYARMGFKALDYRQMIREDVQ